MTRLVLDFVAQFHTLLELLGLALAVFIVVRSCHRIGPTEVGLVLKRYSSRKLSKDNPIAFNGEAGYEADLLMPGLRWKLWPLYSVAKYPWVQVPPRRNRCRARTGWPAVANRREVGRLS